MGHADAKNFIDYSCNGIAEVFFVDEALFDVLQVGVVLALDASTNALESRISP